MEIKNDSWIETIQRLEKEIGGFQGTSAYTPKVGLALQSLATARFWLQEDKADIIPEPGRSDAQGGIAQLGDA